MSSVISLETFVGSYYTAFMQIMFGHCSDIVAKLEVDTMKRDEEEGIMKSKADEARDFMNSSIGAANLTAAATEEFLMKQAKKPS